MREGQINWKVYDRNMRLYIENVFFLCFFFRVEILCGNRVEDERSGSYFVDYTNTILYSVYSYTGFQRARAWKLSLTIGQ